jgi:2-hydroxychromene-2-carboxylate isomerase
MTLRFYFDVISPYAYLAYHGLGPIATRHGVAIEATPVLIAGLLNHHGQKGPAEIPSKRLQLFYDVFRSARRMGLPLLPPPSHPFNPLLALRVCSLDMPPATRWALIGGLMDLVWAGGGDVTDPATVEAVANALGVDDAVARATTPENKNRLKAATSAAIDAGVFGVPTMLVSDQMFWGFDTLRHLDEYLGGTPPPPANLVARWASIQATASR